MTTLKMKDIQKMSKDERMKKIEEMKFELVKAKANPTKAGSKAKEIKRIIARILTFNNQNKNAEVVEHK
ncbi:MAG: 50S ribosomal protein L29 [Candidatus Nanoarchaeia archaeon]|nr:50S ribosomal protein L29 [Candidatus Nanoarchaeia archaeon]MDD5358198.1 50S ribosomal protein L29 [Candidatus Nanoarchaeia archaeon]MDD5589464.1 50S ribosomal protein L29 [Candidatus Nanoarchaeia archaeon]